MISESLHPPYDYLHEEIRKVYCYFNCNCAMNYESKAWFTLLYLVTIYYLHFYPKLHKISHEQQTNYCCFPKPWLK